MHPPTASRRRAVRAAIALSEGLLKLEQALVIGLMGLLMTLILVNVASRYAGRSIYWIDEAAVYAVVWLTFIGASAMTRFRLDFAVGLLTEQLGESAARVAKVLATATSLCFAIGLAVMCWLWLDPSGIAAAGFDAKAFAERTFNFIYTERTQALGWPNWVLYLVVPLFAVTSALHTLANLLEDMGLQAPRERNLGASLGAEG